MGLASNIVYKNIIVKNVTFPIYVTQKWVEPTIESAAVEFGRPAISIKAKPRRPRQTPL